MPSPKIIALAALPFVTACQTTIEQATMSGFATPDASGKISAGMISTLSGSDKDVSGGGYGYQVGILKGKGFKAVAGIIPGTTVTALPASGHAVMSGTYELARATDITLSNSFLKGTKSSVRDGLTLTADFGAHTLKGTSTLGFLTVDGTFSGQTLGGTVQYKGVGGTLGGMIGGDKAVGIFHGNSPTMIYAGGFIVK